MSQSYESFGKYILLEKLATGGMAEVYLAKSIGAGGVSKFVAVKRILPQFSENLEFIDMFKDEAKIAVNLSHSNIVSIHEFGVESSQFFLVMDYVEGRNLRQMLNKMKKGPHSFSIEQILYVVKEVAAGLDHAHRCLDSNTGKPLNITHRDMSPQNIMVSFEGEVKIVDFGIAKAETQIETTRAGTLKGKFNYMSPEQAEGQEVDLRTDVFSLGIVLWELLANDRLFVANTEMNALRKIRDCQIPSLRKINPNIPQELEKICNKALARDRNLRYQTAADFHKDLNRFLNRHYPDFSPHDFSVFIKTLFSNDIIENRKKIVQYAAVEGPSIYARVERTEITSTQTHTDADGMPATGFTNKKHLSLEPPKGLELDSKPLTPNPTPGLAALDELHKLRVNNSERPLESGTFTGSIGYKGSYSRTSHAEGWSFTRNVLSPMALIIFFTLGGVYIYLNPQAIKPLVSQIQSQIQKGAPRTVDPIQSDFASKAVMPFVVTSNPPGATIYVDGNRTNDVTPATISTPPGQNLIIKLTLTGYLDSPNLSITPTADRNTLKVDLVPAGYIDIKVAGAGEIYIDGKKEARSGPLTRHPVSSGKEHIVVAYDKTTGASDEIRVRVEQNQVKAVNLIPRATKNRGR